MPHSVAVGDAVGHVSVIDHSLRLREGGRFRFLRLTLHRSRSEKVGLRCSVVRVLLTAAARSKRGCVVV